MSFTTEGTAGGFNKRLPSELLPTYQMAQIIVACSNMPPEHDHCFVCYQNYFGSTLLKETERLFVKNHFTQLLTSFWIFRQNKSQPLCLKH